MHQSNVLQLGHFDQLLMVQMTACLYLLFIKDLFVNPLLLTSVGTGSYMFCTVFRA